jgi:hypothetical protein
VISFLVMKKDKPKNADHWDDSHIIGLPSAAYPWPADTHRLKDKKIVGFVRPKKK